MLTSYVGCVKHLTLELLTSGEKQQMKYDDVTLHLLDLDEQDTDFVG